MSGSTTTVTTTPTKTFATIAAEWGSVIVSILVLMIFLGAIIVAWITRSPSLDVLLGMAGSNAGIAVGFWLGSSSGSQKKDSTIAAITGAPTPDVPMAVTRTTTTGGVPAL